MKLLTLTTDLTHPGFLQFKKFYDFFGYDYEVLNPRESAFGFQMPFIIEWCSQHRNDEFIYADAWDTIALADIVELRNKLPNCEFYGGGEYGCWPDHSLTDKFPNLDKPYKYPCGGTWYAKTEWLIDMWQRFPNRLNNYDQHWLQIVFLESLKEGKNVQMDYYGNIFQSIMLDPPESFEIKGGRVINTLYNTKPVILHGNGKTPMDRYYDIL